MFKTVALAGLASVASAHILMTNPVPFSGTISNPLDGSGSNFPCQAVSYGGGGDNTYAQGSTQQLSFKGTAVHGGGSCQVSITTDTNPTADSVWKVIKSIEGGCPAQGQEGNMGSNPNAEVPYKYNFTIPDDLPPNDYVFAWTWFNKVGNREMYMNCAPVTITGSGGDDGFLDSLPDMFVANAGNGCSTEESADLKFPDPGADVEQLNGATSAFAGPIGSCPTGSSGDSRPRPSSANPKPSVTPTPTPTPSPRPTVPSSVFVPEKSSASSNSTSATAAPTTTAKASASPKVPVVEAPVATLNSTQIPVAAPNSTQTPIAAPKSTLIPVAAFNRTQTSVAAPSSTQTAGTACANEGYWNCVGGSAFQRCASGVWSPVQRLAPGTSCTGGVDTPFTIVNGTKSVNQQAGRHRTMRRAMRAKN